MILSWQKRRSRFNHDWLRNKYLNRFDAFIERLKIPNPDPLRLCRFVEDDLPEWKKQQSEIENLLKTFEMEMSPKSLFEKLPLKHCDDETSIWLGQLTHALWLARYPVKKWIHTGQSAFKDADDQYNNIIEVLQKKKLDCQSEDYRLELESIIYDFLNFREACENLSRAVGMFPHQILAV